MQETHGFPPSPLPRGEARLRSLDSGAERGRSGGGRLRSTAGLTLIETVVVVAIAAIVLITAVPLVGNVLAEFQVRGAAEQVAEVLRRTRQDAIAAAATYSVAMTASSLQVTCTNGTPAGNVCPPARAPDRTEPVAPAVTLSWTVSPISFAPNGAGTASIVTIAFAGATSRQVEVRTPGTIRCTPPPC